MSIELKYMEWNLHTQGGGNGYKIPEFVAANVKSADIFVLVEFLMSGSDDFRNQLSDFDIYCSPYVPRRYNRICIGM